MDYKSACDTIVALQRELCIVAQQRAGLKNVTLEDKAYDATYVLLEYLAGKIKEGSQDSQ